jgi:hypothetical protein
MDFNLESAPMNTEDERKASEDAEAIVNSLVPRTPRSDAKLSIIRNAAVIAASKITGLPSQAALDDVRDKAATMLNGVNGSLGTSMLTQELIEHARSAVGAWRRELAAHASAVAAAAVSANSPSLTSKLPTRDDASDRA